MDRAPRSRIDASAFAPIRPGVLSTEVLEQIRERILDGSLPLGSRVRDSVLAEAMGVSRSPVREALRTLEQRGLVRKSPNHSYEVVTFSERDIHEIALLRVAYETMAARELIERRVELAPLRARLDDLVLRDDGKGSRSAVAGADGRFHTELVRLTHLPRLIASYGALRDQIDLLLANGFLTRGEFIATQRERHEDLIEVVAAGAVSGNAEPSVIAIREHILGGMLFTDDWHPPGVG
ncbi:GntR family transcriptional regulator [Frondihabitans sucicola]|uniref:GntR family transcriptional regulator n=1 Tax=Frondihabitans sucicola TaxID=1268041 RepID=A0ABN6XW80_9MICO|nr:GntR family transcriptional regulator [Frondihabitans sucicola]BDZ47900.1 GntR family transcriptional regulator [Frondihabitans sucicola]